MIRVFYRDFDNNLSAAEPNIIQYPDGTMHIRIRFYGLNAYQTPRIVWKYENEAELLRLIYVTRHIAERYGCPVDLFMPYLPNARMDRIRQETEIYGEVFTLKYFCGVVNSLGFRQVEILDVHSAVGAALLDRVKVQSPEKYIRNVMQLIDFRSDTDCLFFPDEGSCKRYADCFRSCRSIAFGIKKRDFDTGKILGLEIVGDIPQNSRVLILDDICSRGGTVYHTAKKLKTLGAGDIYAYFTHCENTITEGELLKGDLLKGVYTTDSICTLDTAKYPKLHIQSCTLK